MRNINLLHILLFFFLSLDSPFCAEKPIFLRPPNYQVQFRELPEFAHCQTLDLSGEWRYSYQEQKFQDKVMLPASWDHFSGKITFTRSFKIDSTQQQKNIHLIILGLSHRCIIYLNNELIGEFEGPIIDAIFPQRLIRFDKFNLLEIEVDNSLNPLNTIPLRSGSLRHANYGGIYGDIFLLMQNTPGISFLQVITESSPDGSTGLIWINFKIFKSPLQEITGKAICNLIAPDGKMVAVLSQEILNSDTVSLKIEVPKPQLWSPSHPILYTLEIFLETTEGNSEVQLRRIGFRNFSFDNGFILNDKKLQIRGIGYLPENSFGLTLNKDDYIRDLELIKLSGANAIILLEPVNPYFLQLCDSLGMLVFQSSSLQGVPSKIFLTKNFAQICQNYIRQIISHTVHHPSIVAWIIGREMEKEFPFKSLLEIFPPNDNHPILFEEMSRPHNLRLIQKSNTLYNLVVGSSGLEYVLTDTTEKSESMQLNELEYLIDKAKNQPAIFLSDFADWQASRKVLYGGKKQPDLIHHTGLVTRERKIRLLYSRLQQGWYTSNHPKLPFKTSTQPLEYPLAGMALLAIILAYLKSNQVFRAQFKRVFVHSHGFFTDIHHGRFISKIQTTWVCIASTLTVALFISMLLYFYRHDIALDYITAHLLTGDAIHSCIINIIWTPIQSVIFLILLISLIFILEAIFFKLSVTLLRKRVAFSQSLIFIIWSAAGFMWLIPLTIIFYQCLSVNLLKKIEIVILGLFLFWIYLRILKAVRVKCVVGYIKAFFVFSMVNLLFLSLIAFYLQYYSAVFYYWNYIYAVLL